jgi:hypothetical protein
MARVRQRFPKDRVSGARNAVREQLLAAGLRRKLFRGAHVAITAGSRGMGGFVDLLAGIVDAVKAAGARPFIIPAMGSHGGATAAGQTELLRRLGVTEESVGAPIQSSMDTLKLGVSDTGAAAHVDNLAAVVDGIIVLGRVKTHPENREGVASGLLKMVTVGLGKQIGAQSAHAHGLWTSVRAVPRMTLARTKILFGVAVVENAYREPVIVEVVPASYEAFEEADVRLLKAAKRHVGTLPFRQLDVLVADEIGKNISGTGMDLNVIGKWRVSGGKREPDFLRIAALSLTPESLGNGLGVGLADFTTRRLADEYDAAATYVNVLTATGPGEMNTREGPLPLALASDREAIEVALVSALAGSRPRLCRIRNTARLDEFWITEALLEEAQSAGMVVIEPPRQMEFDGDGNLF